MRKKIIGEGSGEEIVANVLRGQPHPKQTITVRLPQDLMAEMRAEANRRGLPVAIILEERCRRSVVRLSSGVLKDARPWGAVGYRIGQASTALVAGNVAEATAHLHAARDLVAGQLMNLKIDFDADLDAQDERRDAWSG